ncbi:MAG: GNAT family N-acetyltransferase [Rhodobiaceae bacterium]|jgi:[ribosomal protein S5]-alanine N-acetyltransferase|nr:GNAT family N-acetyltransferase [Rhodobiaceae bacterium]MBT6223732.1 GNAT family N-acetyltransferase [Rhodobiaceae bacterium]
MDFFRSLISVYLKSIIRNNDLYIRAPRLSDYNKWYLIRSESKDFLQPWEPLWSANHLSKSYYKRLLKSYHAGIRDEVTYPFFIFNVNNELIGAIILTNVKRGVSQSGSVGYWIGKKYSNRGYMTAAMDLFLSFVCNTLKLHRIEASCIPNNIASIALLEKVGFIGEGMAFKYLKINGIWQDHLLYGMLCSNYKTMIKDDH